MKTIAEGNDFDAEVTKQTGVVLVDFYTDDCAPCRMMMPVLEELAIEQSDFKIVKVDAATNHKISRQVSAYRQCQTLFCSAMVKLKDNLLEQGQRKIYSRGLIPTADVWLP